MTEKAPRSKALRPGRVRLSTNISRELDRKLRAWAGEENVSLAAIVENALERHFGHLHRFASSGTIDRVSRSMQRQQEREVPR